MITEKEALGRINNTLGDEYSIVSTTLDKDTYSKAKITVHHSKCGNDYTTSTENIVHNKRKCPFCSRSHRVSKQEAIKRIQNKYGDEYTFMEEYKGYSIPINIKHNCGNIIHVKPGDLVEGNNCKECTYKSDHTEPVVFKDELWLPYKDTGYTVSNIGNVKNSKGAIIKATKQSTGYYKVMLYINGKNKYIWRYRLVAETFIPNADNLPMVNHVDETHDNDRVDNLQWCSARYNANYGTLKKRKTGTKVKGRGVYAIYQDGTDMYFSALSRAEEYFGGSVTTAHICAVLKGRQKTTGGLMFERA